VWYATTPNGRPWEGLASDDEKRRETYTMARLVRTAFTIVLTI
jgi:hypothetical protein